MGFPLARESHGFSTETLPRVQRGRQGGRPLEIRPDLCWLPRHGIVPAAITAISVHRLDPAPGNADPIGSTMALLQLLCSGDGQFLPNPFQQKLSLP
jgi:hypothetical protein